LTGFSITAFGGIFNHRLWWDFQSPPSAGFSTTAFGGIFNHRLRRDFQLGESWD